MVFRIFACLTICFAINDCIAQGTVETNMEKQGKIIGFEGMIAYATNPSENYHAINVGGPVFHLRLKENIRIGVGALPSFYIRNGRAGGKLGVSPRLDFKKWVIIAPFYHFDSEDRWIWTLGVGYKFN